MNGVPIHTLYEKNYPTLQAVDYRALQEYHLARTHDKIVTDTLIQQSVRRQGHLAEAALCGAIADSLDNPGNGKFHKAETAALEKFRASRLLLRETGATDIISKSETIRSLNRLRKKDCSLTISLLHDYLKAQRKIEKLTVTLSDYKDGKNEMAFYLAVAKCKCGVDFSYDFPKLSINEVAVAVNDASRETTSLPALKQNQANQPVKARSLSKK